GGGLTLETGEQLVGRAAAGRVVGAAGHAGRVLAGRRQAQVALGGDHLLLEFVRVGRVGGRDRLVHVDDVERARGHAGLTADAAVAQDLHGAAVQERDGPDRARLQARGVGTV